jgi:hypothetical protein
MILIHSTHEAGFKLGGIGAVLDGLLSSPSYLAQVDRTLLVGIMHMYDRVEMERLFSPGNGLQVTYFATGNLYGSNCAPALAAQLGAVEARWSVRLLYGHRTFGTACHEVILVDSTDVPREKLGGLKYLAWERFGLESNRYENEYEFEQYMSAAPAAFEALKTVLNFGFQISDSGQARPVQSSIADQQSKIIVCHEFMGLPLWYAADIAQHGAYKSAYVAHEVPSARAMVEGHPGHDTRFYNVLRQAHKLGLSVDEVFGDQSGYFKHAMLKTATYCDYVLAVGDLVVDELRFVDKRFKAKKIDLVYNGVASNQIFLPDVRASKARLCSYAQTLTGLSPTYIFSHVTRMVVSKGLWRDLRMMEVLDPLLAERNESAVLILLSSVMPQGRTAAEVEQMAAEYGWPRNHRDGWPDLVALESPLWKAISAFNATARASRIALVNQFGFSRDRCGDSMPADMSFEDLRGGTDLEFGMSVYEPFGIAQIEPLAAGALCVESDVCGCLGFINRQLAQNPQFYPLEENDRIQADTGEDKQPFLNVLVTDFTTLARPNVSLASPNPVAAMRAAMTIGQRERDALERHAVQASARAIIARLPRNDTEKQMLLDNGYLLAQQMSWDVVARTQLLPAITR